MTDVQAVSLEKTPCVALAADPFEDGWDCGVDWANERATLEELAGVQQLHTYRCFELSELLRKLGCKADDLFLLSPDVTDRHVEGFVEGAVAIYRSGGL